MQWVEFKESENEYPEKIVQEVTAGFTKVTNNFASLDVSKLSEASKLVSYLEENFQYEVILRSSYVYDYTFSVFKFGYNIELLPIKLILETSIYESVFNTLDSYRKVLTFDDPEKFRELLGEVFRCNRFVEIVAGLLKLAKKGR